ncbi:MAG: CoA transferase [Hyphomicrobiaceae bacterium TMED74]|nr:carnitine dehydratase [Filomicrobium sp.]RPG45744.1 MAG: CoA transferase [Hyphomicrobiaceae bacterium TMED74]
MPQDAEQKTQKPLDGVRVLDLATFIAAPFAATVLGEFGAEVIKVEHPDGDPMRVFGTPTEVHGETLAWLSEARNKHSVTMDFKSEEGVAKLKELVRRSDILTENFRPGTLEKWGIGPDVLHEINPKLVIIRISGYGQTGPYRDRPGFARIAHAVGGLTYLAGLPGNDTPPVTPGSTSLADYISGFYGALGGLLALRVAEQTGKGQVVDVALFESIFRVLDEMAPLYSKHGIVREREGVSTRNACPHGHFPTADGKWVAIACTSDRMWDRMARNVLKKPELAESHPKTKDRIDDRDLIEGIVEAFTKSLPMAEVVQQCTDGDVPCGSVNSVADIFNDPHFAARQTMTTFKHALHGDITVPSTLPRLSETPGSIENLGPSLGDWNDYVFNQLIKDDSEIRVPK